MSSVKRRPALYVLVALVALAELMVFGLALRPNAAPDYRAYYIDETTTCLNQPIIGEYMLGERVSFRSGSFNKSKPLRVCGWEGPAGDGTHAVGETSRLRFSLNPPPESAVLSLRMVALNRPDHPVQHVIVRANGVIVGDIALEAGQPAQTVDMVVPPEAMAANPGALDVVLDFPDAISISQGDSNTRKRSIKLISARVSAAS